MDTDFRTGPESGQLFFERCELCRHYTGGSRCKAFPDGIPDEIIAGVTDHIEPHPGDHGIQFEPEAGRPVA